MAVRDLRELEQTDYGLVVFQVQTRAESVSEAAEIRAESILLH